MKQQFTEMQLIEKGWSSDQKFCALRLDGSKVLYRVSPADQYHRKKTEYEMMLQVAALDVSMCQPLEFGICDEGVYSVQSWIEGEDAQDIIPLLSDTDAYAYGLEAGKSLRKIHSIPAPACQEDWESRFNRKIDHKIKGYINCPLKFNGAEQMMEYINANRQLLKHRPQTYQHGDYHIGNMMIDSSGKLVIIDFNRCDFGDPWEEFNRIVWCAQKSPFFASGMLNGYFNDIVPEDFWKLLELYIFNNTLSAVCWIIPFGQSQTDIMLKQAEEVLEWYGDMKNPIPTWYFKVY